MGVWVGEWMGSCQVTKIQIILDMTEMIQICFKIYDLCTLHQLWMGVWVVE